MLSRFRCPDLPEPIGVFRAVERPSYDSMLNDQVKTAIDQKGEGEIESLFTSGDTWEVTE